MKTWIQIMMLVVGMCMMTCSAFAEIQTATGWSVNPDELSAVQEAVGMVQKHVVQPNLVVLYTTVDYNVGAVVDAVNQELPGVPVFGTTSSGAVVTEAGMHVGEKGSLAVMGLAGDNLKVGVGIAAFADETEKTISAATQTAMADAAKQAGLATHVKPTLIYMSASLGTEEVVLNAIEAMYGKETPIYGGSGADNDLSGQWQIIGNSQVYPAGVSLAFFYTDAKVGGAFQAGYLGSTISGTVTDADGRTLKTIDNKPAGDVFNEWAKGAFTKRIEANEMVLYEASFHTLAKKLELADGKEEYVFVHALKIDPETHSIFTASNTQTGQQMYFLEGTSAARINRVTNIVRQSFIDGRIKKSKVAGGLFIFCGGAKGAVGDRISEIVPKINNAMGDRPWIGAFTFGEQGYFRGWGNIHGNLMSSMVCFGNN